MVASSRTALTIGRAIASIGRAGLGLYRALWYYRLSGKSRTERQPSFMGVMGATYALASFEDDYSAALPLKMSSGDGVSISICP